MEEYNKIKDLPYNDRLTYAAKEMLKYKIPVETISDEQTRIEITQRMVEVLLSQKHS
jgi:hypothetical protein